MNLGIESETLELKKSTGEIEKAINSIASISWKVSGPEIHPDEFCPCRRSGRPAFPGGRNRLLRMIPQRYFQGEQKYVFS